MPELHSIFDGKPASRAETKAFVEWTEELKKHKGQGLLGHYYIAVLADKVFILNTKTFTCLMTTKLTLLKFWPEKVEELEK